MFCCAFFIYPWILNSIIVTFVTIYKVNNTLEILIPIVRQYLLPTLAIILSCLCGKLGFYHIWNNVSYKISVTATVFATFIMYLFFN